MAITVSLTARQGYGGCSGYMLRAKPRQSSGLKRSVEILRLTGAMDIRTLDPSQVSAKTIKIKSFGSHSAITISRISLVWRLAACDGNRGFCESHGAGAIRRAGADIGPANF